MFPQETETKRLMLERLSRENVDVDDLYARFSTSAPHVDDIYDQIPDEPFETEKDIVDFIEQAQSEWKTNEAAVYAVIPKSNEDKGEQLAGYAHLWMKWERRKAELGLLLDKPFWGHEYATEVYLMLTEIAFDLHGIDLIEIGHPMPNTNSHRSIEKFIDEAGGQHLGIVPNNVWCGDNLCDSNRYAVMKEDFNETNR